MKWYEKHIELVAFLDRRSDRYEHERRRAKIWRFESIPGPKVPRDEERWYYSLKDEKNVMRANGDAATRKEAILAIVRAAKQLGWRVVDNPFCQCTHEAGDSRCEVHPGCNECGEETEAPVDSCAEHR